MIKIFPLDHISAAGLDEYLIIKKLTEHSSPIKLCDIIGNYVFFKSGKDSIRAIIEQLHLKLGDEVYITTTTDSSYVSTCVSATIFNYCKISRVLTEKTKAIFVIHTFGFPHPKLLELRNIADGNNIPLIEDCISAFNSFSEDNLRLGSIGDYAVYSLPKIFPIKYGGILTSKKNKIKGINDIYLQEELKLWSPYLDELRNIARRNYFFLKKFIGNPLYLNDKNVYPYMYGFLSKDYKTIINKISEFAEVGKTHTEKEVHIPVNPFIQLNEYNQLINIVK